MKSYHTILATIVLFGLLVLFSNNKDKCGPDEPDPPLTNCNNAIKDGDETSVDCGGSCLPCFAVDPERELIIKNLNVVNSTAATTGALSFGQLMARLRPAGTSTKDFMLSLLQSWDNSFVMNGFTIGSRPGIRTSIIDEWKNRDGASGQSDADWNMDITNAPLRLLAITSRLDLDDLSAGKAGEGRLTFGIDNGSNTFTLIFEYNLAGSTSTDVVKWAKRWHGLSDMNENSSGYRDSVIQIVQAFSSRPTDLSQLRTNEILGDFGSGLWEFREFRIAASNGLLEEVTRKQNPSTDLQNSPALTNYVDTNRGELESGNHTITSNTVLAGNARYTSNFTWSAPSLPAGDPALATLDFISCTGCHGGLVPGTGFTHIKPRLSGAESGISLFLDQDLIRRQEVVSTLLELPIPPTPPAALADSTIVASSSLDPRANNIQAIKDLLDRFKDVKRVH